MAKPLPAPFDKQKVVAENRRARYDYFVEEQLRGGDRAAGTEVKALRLGEGSIAESYATVEGEEVWLINSHIPEYSHGNRLNHEPRRPRQAAAQEARDRQAPGRGHAPGPDAGSAVDLFQQPPARPRSSWRSPAARRSHDKRETIKERDWKREQERLLRAPWLRPDAADTFGTRSDWPRL